MNALVCTSECGLLGNTNMVTLLELLTIIIRL